MRLYSSKDAALYIGEKLGRNVARQRLSVYQLNGWITPVDIGQSRYRGNFYDIEGLDGCVKRIKKARLKKEKKRKGRKTSEGHEAGGTVFNHAFALMSRSLVSRETKAQ